VVEPVVRLELDPRRSEQIQRRGGDEAIGLLARHQALADNSRIGRHEQLVRRTLAVLPGEIPPKAHAHAAHTRHLERIELAIRVAGISESLVWQGLSFLCPLDRCRAGIAIMEIEAAQLDAQGTEVEGAEDAWELVPRQEFVDQVECPDRHFLRQRGFE